MSYFGKKLNNPVEDLKRVKSNEVKPVDITQNGHNNSISNKS